MCIYSNKNTKNEKNTQINYNDNDYHEIRILSAANKTIKAAGFSYGVSSTWLLDKSSWYIGEGNVTNYEPYKGESYQVNLGTENIINNTMTSQTLNGVSFTVNEDKSIKAVGTATARTEPNLWNNANLTLKANTNYYNNSNTTIYLQGTYNGAANQYFILNEGATYNREYDYIVQRVYIRVENGQTIDTTIYPQISTLKAESYTPYGTTPIEMASIPNTTYKDLFVKENGTWYKREIVAKVRITSTMSKANPNAGLPRSENGCTVRFLNYQKHYSWDELKTKRLDCFY